jgi:hypothetical protein
VRAVATGAAGTKTREALEAGACATGKDAIVIVGSAKSE